jgi:NTP pyrophosphatase (non-canonical NTP hydrolase)
MPSRTYRTYSLEVWCSKFAKANAGSWDDVDSTVAWLRFVETATTRIAEFVRREAHSELIDELGSAFGWLCCFVERYQQKHPQEAFRITKPLSDVIWHKYPGVCYRCTHKFPSDQIASKGFLACVCLATPAVSQREKNSAARKLAIARKKKAPPTTLEGWAAMTSAIYGPNHRELSLAAICLHFLEEVGEVAKCLRQLREADPLVVTHHERKALIQDLEDEIADVFSWNMGVLNKLDQVLDSSREYYASANHIKLPSIVAPDVAYEALRHWRGRSIP